MAAFTALIDKLTDLQSVLGAFTATDPGTYVDLEGESWPSMEMREAMIAYGALTLYEDEGYHTTDLTQDYCNACRSTLDSVANAMHLFWPPKKPVQYTPLAEWAARFCTGGQNGGKQQYMIEARKPDGSLDASKSLPDGLRMVMTFDDLSQWARCKYINIDAVPGGISWLEVIWLNLQHHGLIARAKTW